MLLANLFINDFTPSVDSELNNFIRCGLTTEQQITNPSITFPVNGEISVYGYYITYKGRLISAERFGANVPLVVSLINGVDAIQLSLPVEFFDKLNNHAHAIDVATDVDNHLEELLEFPKYQ